MLITLFMIAFGCTKKHTTRLFFESNGKLKVLCTLSMIEDVVKEVGGGYVDTLALIQGDLDPHSYELCKGDDEKLHYADLIFYNGLGLEHGASLNYHLQRTKKAIAVGNFVDKGRLIEVEGVIDPHIWMDVSIWKEIVDPIAKLLAEKDPKNKKEYFKNAQALKEKMSRIHEQMQSILKAVNPNRRHLITTHDAFHYFVRAYMAKEEEIATNDWVARLIAPEGLAPEGQVSTLDIKRILDFTKKTRVEVVFAESNLSQTSLKKIVDAARKNGICLTIAKEPLYGDAMMKSTGPFVYGATLLYNAKTIANHLKGGMNE